MRPVERGPHPQDTEGNRVIFGEYQDARGALITRLGEYCSFCEMHLDADLAVEHKLPKAIHPALRLEWSNFLLACRNCNSTKGDKDIVLEAYFWPDTDNTAYAFRYGPSARIQVNLDLSSEEQERASNILALVGLTQPPRLDPRLQDRRWLNRQEAWDIAQEASSDLKQQDTPEHRRTIIQLALAKGYWSIWRTVFEDDAPMRQALLAQFPGTAKTCFDAEGNLLPLRRSTPTT